MVQKRDPLPTRVIRQLRQLRGAIARERVRMRNRLRLPSVRIVHHPGYDIESSGLIDGRRGSRVLEYLLERRWLEKDDVIVPRPIQMRDLLSVHDPEYLARLDETDEITRVFGGLVRPGPEAERVLQTQRMMVAGTVTATRVALRFPRVGGPVVNLGGGLHHAKRHLGGGFCAFNDIAVAIELARQNGFSGRVLVVDLDAHHGDGTRSIFAEDPRVFTFSIHAKSWDDSPAVASLDVAVGPSVGDSTYLRALEKHLPTAFAKAKPDLVFYVAGADIAETDTLGGFRVSLAGVLARDQLVLGAAAGIPTVVLMAGGYGDLAWRPPTRMVLWLMAGAEVAIPSGDELALDQFRAIRESISRSVLSGEKTSENDFDITEEDLYGGLHGGPRDERFLGFYTRHGLEVACERYGLAEHLRKRGYANFYLETLPESAVGTHVMRIYADESKAEILIELSMRELTLPDSLRMLSIEWLLMQDPKRAPKTPLLPGQTHPGLGCLRIIVGMLVMAAERLGFDGLTVVPSHYHVAAQAKRLMNFLAPEDQAYFAALQEATRGLGLLDASHALSCGHVVDSSGDHVQWSPRRMAIGTSERLRSRLSSEAYSSEVEAAALKLVLKETRTDS